MKYLWLISQDENSDYDTYDSAVVVAGTEEEARKITPRGTWERYTQYSSWCSSPEKVTVKRLGVADDHLQSGEVVLASFNAG